MNKYLIEYISNMNIPKDLRTIIENSIIKPINIGESGAKVYSVDSINNTFILKLSENELVKEELVYEYEILKKIVSLGNVPEVKYFIANDNCALMLRSRIKGKQIDNEINNPEVMVEMCGRELRSIHNYNIDGMDLRTIKDKLELAKLRVDIGYVEEDNFEEEFLGMSSNELYQKLINDRRDSDDIVFTHGDFTFENILYSEKNGVGIIDWGRAMKSDRYQDIGLFIRSLKHKYGTVKMKELVKVFCKSYGLEELDLHKVEFYILLDEFF